MILNNDKQTLTRINSIFDTHKKEVSTLKIRSEPFNLFLQSIFVSETLLLTQIN